MDMSLSSFRDGEVSNEEMATRNTEDSALNKRTFRSQSPNGPSSDYKRPRRSRKSINRDLGFQIYEDSDAPKAEVQYRSFYGSNAPVLLEKRSGKDIAKYQDIHGLCRHAEAVKEMMEAVGEWGERHQEAAAPYLQYGVKTFTERVTGFYEWTYLQEPNDVWLWVYDKRYHRRWTQEQGFGFCEMLHEMNHMVKGAVEAKTLHGTVSEDAVCPFLMNRLRQLGITNLFVHNYMPYIYHFYPCGEDRPRYRRADFTELEAYRIDWQELGRHWLDGEAREIGGEENLEFNVQVKAAYKAEIEAFFGVSRAKGRIIEAGGRAPPLGE